MSALADYYSLLKLNQTATPDEVRAAYARERADSIVEGEAGGPSAEPRLLELDEAYAALSNPAQREAYDRSLTPGDSADALALAAISDSLAVPNGRLGLSERPCPHCGKANPFRATVCVKCERKMSRPCPQCAHPVPHGQIVCPRCETAVGEHDIKIDRYVEGVNETVASRRQAEDARKVVAEAEQRARISSTTVFWVVVTIVVIGLLALSAVSPWFFQR